jgi:hypothetical protein
VPARGHPSGDQPQRREPTINIKRLITALAATAGAVIGGVALAAGPASAAPATCPEVTDSVERLYSAYFLRQSDPAGLAFWDDQYMTAKRSLTEISDWFAISPEFVARYGAVNDATFVQLIYHNVLGRDPDGAGYNYWLGRLTAHTITRGGTMLMFSESPEFVEKTNTEVPLAGYFNVYPKGTTFYCGVGPDTVPILKNAATAGATQMDVLGWNLGDAPQDMALATLDAKGNVKNLILAATAVAPNYYDYMVNAAFTRSLSVYIGTDFDATRGYWTVAIHPPMAVSARAGWF